MNGTWWVEIVLGSVALLIMLLGWLARKCPEVAWLRAFDLRAGLSDAQRRRLLRRHNVSSGAQLILFGLALPIGYIFLTAFTLSDFSRTGIALVAAGSILCILLGVIAIARSARA